jgi:hypothetical protein
MRAVAQRQQWQRWLLLLQRLPSAGLSWPLLGGCCLPQLLLLLLLPCLPADPKAQHNKTIY